MTDHPQAAVDALAAMLTSNLIVNSPHPHHSARAILDTIARLLTAPLQAELNRYREDSHIQALTINRLAMAAEDRTVVDIARHKTHQAELDTAYAEAHACGAERETWKDRAEAAELARDDAQALVSCACGYDRPTDICMAHIAILNRVRPDHPAFDRARKDSEAKLALAMRALLWHSDDTSSQGDLARAALSAINGETK